MKILIFSSRTPIVELLSSDSLAQEALLFEAIPDLWQGGPDCTAKKAWLVKRIINQWMEFVCKNPHAMVKKHGFCSNIEGWPSTHTPCFDHGTHARL
jgi:hypothetical protein